MRASTVSATGILLVENEPLEREVALSGLTQAGLSTETVVILSDSHALPFLRRSSALERTIPAVTILGPGLPLDAALGLLIAIRGDAPLRSMPVVMIGSAPGGDWIRSAYAGGANSVVLRHEDVRARAERYAALTRFWIGANEPAPVS